MPRSAKNICFHLLEGIHPFLSPDQQNQAWIDFATYLDQQHIHYNQNYNDKGSMTDASHTKSAAITEVMIQTMTRCIPLSIAELQNMSEEQVEAYLKCWLRRHCYNIQWRNGNLNGSYTRRRNESSPSFSRQHTSTEYRNNNGEIKPVPLTVNYTPTLEDEENMP